MLGLRLAMPEINHVSSCVASTVEAHKAATGTGQSLVRASRQLSSRWEEHDVGRTVEAESATVLGAHSTGWQNR
jgi:hypothetical protein